MLFLLKASLFLSLFLLTDGKRVLMLPVQLHSHIYNFVDIGTELVKRGHEVYTVSYKGYRQLPSELGIKTIYLPCKDQHRCTPEAIRAAQANSLTLAIKHKGNFMEFSDKVTSPIDYACKEIVTDETFWKELNGIKFDLAFVDGLIFFRCLYLVPHRLGIPWVTLSDYIDPLVPRLPWLPSFVPHPGTEFTPRMNFVEKLKNTFTMARFHYGNLMPELPEDVLKQYKGYGYFHSLKELEGQSLLWFLTDDEVVDYPKPLMPNVISVGGLSVKPAKKLNAEFTTYLEKSKHGVVLVSFGSYLSDLPDDIASEMINAFKQMKENVIWKYVNKNKLPMPPNVKLSDWIPQNDLLANEKIKLFITHGGNNGKFEALYHGKPMLAMPILGDQLSNAGKVEYLELGQRINLYNFTTLEMFLSMREIIDNSKYKTNMVKSSMIFRNREETPVQRSVFWLEHVMKFGGSHLRSYALDMPLYQYFMLDIMLCILLVFVCLSAVVITCVRCMYVRMCKSKKKHHKTD